MSSSHLIKRTPPSKPYPDFPLFAHQNGCWAKKIRGKLHYFGVWENPDAALAKYLEQKDALHSDKTIASRPDPAALTVKELANAFMNAKVASRDAGELTPRSWQDYKDACELFISHFGTGRLVSDLGPDDFASLREKLAKRWGPTTLGNVIQRMRVAFKFAFDNGLIDRPVRYGQGFKRPSKKTLRVHKAQQGPQFFRREEILLLLLAAGSPTLEAMILLGINCGLGNADCGTLPMSALDLERGLLDFPRPKTGIPRRCPLWPETVEAIREAIAKRPEPKKAAHSGLVFVTRWGAPWGKEVADSPITKEMRKLLNRFGINGHRNFYALRHTFRTIADEAKDQPAADHIMGHESSHMSSHYREGISTERLQSVTDYVRGWLVGVQ